MHMFARTIYYTGRHLQTDIPLALPELLYSPQFRVGQGTCARSLGILFKVFRRARHCPLAT